MSIVKWATLPPIVSIATISLARAMGSALAAVSVDASIWGLVAVTFVILTALYALFIVHGFHVGLLPLQAVAQGILLCPLSLSLGARMFDWAGATMAVCGAAVLAVLYHRTQIRHLYEAAEAEVEAIARVGEMQLHIPVAFAVTDGEGTIVSISDAMLKAAGLVRGEAVGQSIAVILTPGEDVVEIGGKAWRVIQSPMDDDRYFFQLAEPGEAPASAPPPLLSSGPSLFDPATRMETAHYAEMRLDEELYRAGRYGRPLSAALLRVVFAAADEEDGSAQEAFDAWCAATRSRLRASDVASATSARDVLIVLPESSSELVSVIVGKLIGLTDELAPSWTPLARATVLHASASFPGTEGMPGAAALMDQLESDLARKYSLGG